MESYTLGKENERHESIECWKSVDHNKEQSYSGCEGSHFNKFMEGRSTNVNCITLFHFDASIPGGSECLIGLVLVVLFMLSSVACCMVRQRKK